MQLDAIAEAVKKVMAKEAELDETGLRKAAYAAHSAGQKMFTFKGKTYPVKIQGENITYGECMEETVDEATSEKVPTSTGMKVYGHRYGDSAKARKDQTKHNIDKIKEPKDKDLKEEGDCVTEPEAKNIAKKEVKGHEKKMHHKEGYNFSSRLINHAIFAEEVEEELNEVLSKDASAGDWIHDFIHSDNPKFKGKTKAERKKMALGAYYAKQNEEKEAGEKHDDEEEDKELVKKMVKKTALKKEEVKLAEAATRKDFQMVADLIRSHDSHDKRKELASHHAAIFHAQNPRFDHHKFMKACGVSHEVYGEETELEEAKVTTSDTNPDRITTDTLKGREEGGRSNSFQSFKLKLKSDGEMKAPPKQEPADSAAIRSDKAKPGLEDKIDRLDPKYGKPNSFKEESELSEETPKKNQDVADKSYLKDIGKKPSLKGDLKNFGRFLAGKKETNEAKTLSPGQDDSPFEQPYSTTPQNVKDKSGAVHTPMSRAKDLARQAMKRIKTEMLGKAPGNN